MIYGAESHLKIPALRCQWQGRWRYVADDASGPPAQEHLVVRQPEYLQ